MRLFSRFSAFRLTAIAAGLVLVMALFGNPWGGLVHLGSHRAGPIATVVGALVMAGALLDRWRPMRWLVRVTTFFAALTYAGLALAGYRPTLGYATGAVLCGTITAILGSRKVRRWFNTPRNEWGSAAEEALAAAGPATLLPPETLEGALARAPQREAAGSELRDARSKRSPEERK